MNKKHYLVYIVIAVLLCFIPFGAMSFYRTETTTENKTLKEMPSLTTENGYNINILSDLGDYFTDRFAFRNEMVSLNSYISAKLLKTSTVDDVIMGGDGWLYYSATLDDFRHDNPVSERMIYNMAHNVKLMQDYVESEGKTFVFTVAPNKNSLYGGNMPNRYKYTIEARSDVERLIPYLISEGVNYVDIYSLFKSEPEVLYYKGDSHWNNKGAVLAYNALLDAADKDHETYDDTEPEIVSDYYGDLNKMLYSSLAEPEKDYKYREVFPYATLDPNSTVEDDIVETINPSAEGNLLMYRDSFGNSLLPYMASEFENGYFSKVVPYKVSEDLSSTGADVVIAEKVERHLPTLAQVVPEMEAPAEYENTEDISIDFGLEDIELDGEGLVKLLNDKAGTSGWNPRESDGIATYEITSQGEYLRIDGSVTEGSIDLNSPVYVQIEYGEDIVSYGAFCVSSKEGDYGFTALIRPQEGDITALDIVGVLNGELVMLKKGN